MAEPQITRDRDEIEAWADEHDAVPVREGDEVRLVRESDVTADHERLEWEAFHRNVEEGDHAVTYYGDVEDREPFEVSHRDAALDSVVTESTDLDREEAEQRLVEGETITGTVTETTVVEETIVEEATLESEVVDRSTIDQSVVDVQLLGRECQACDVTAESTDVDYLGADGSDRFLADDTATDAVGRDGEYPFDVTVEVREDWLVTVEQRDRYTVETDITDVDVSGTEEIEARDVDADVDVDAVHRQLLDSGILDADADDRIERDATADAGADERIDTERYDIESEFTDQDLLTTYITSRQRFEREISERSRLTAEVIEGELLDRDIVREEAVDSQPVERDEGLETDTAVTEDETATTGTAVTEDETATTDTTVTEDETATTDTTVTEDETATTGMDAEYELDDDVRRRPEDRDEGKTVVDATGEEMGEVIDVNDGVAFVDPHPSLAERVMSRLGFDEDEEYYELSEGSIDRITDDEIVVATDHLDDDVRT